MMIYQNSLQRKLYKYLPRPAYAPERDLTARNESAEITKVMRILGMTPQPWQKFVWERATEYRIVDGQKVYRYSQVLITVPRQSGKTTLLAPLRVYRFLTRPGLESATSAQTGQAARKRMLKFQKLLSRSVLSDFFDPQLTNGSEGVTCLPTGAQMTKFAPVEGQQHGDTLEYVDLDEIWKWSGATGEMVMGAIRPAMVTLYGSAQTWMVSTMGTLRSEFMNGLVDSGRAGTKHDLAYFEWSLPEGQDVFDPSSWWLYHPALGNTIKEEAIAADLPPVLTPSEFLRAYGNRLTATDEALIPADEWQEMTMPPDTPRPPLEDVVVALDVAPENAATAVMAGWWHQDAPYIRVLHQAPGTAWVWDYLSELKRRGFNRFVADNGGLGRVLANRLNDDGAEIELLEFKERRDADALLLGAARDDGILNHDGSKPLAIAVANAQIRQTNGVPLLNRDKSTAPISALIAGGLALYAAAHPLENLPPQIF